MKVEGKLRLITFRRGVRFLNLSMRANMILYRNLNYYLTGGEELTSRGRLDEVEQSVPRPPFYRCHKSFLVNLAHVKDFDEDLNVFEMSEGGVVYVRRQSTREAVRAFRGFMFAQLRENP